jgi:2-polyprenyl-6-hydroxyphenyl methylase/3-demethylubiquinone-9 3-methyltransferase
MRDALRLYARQTLVVKWFVRLRHILSPLEALEELVPGEGRILDLGCGHGLFTNYLALRAPSRDILGVDPSPAKIKVAKTTESMVPNARYLLGSIDDIAENSRFDTITIVDVLYLLPDIEQKNILSVCHRLLADSGVLVLKTQDTRPRWRYWWTCAQESIMVGIGMTHGRGLHFLPAEKSREMLEEAGFTVAQHALPSRILYANIVLIGRKKERKG